MRNRTILSLLLVLTMSCALATRAAGVAAQPRTAASAAATKNWCADLPAGVECHDHWMADLAPVIGNRPLDRIIIPASHDSASYAGQSGAPNNAWVACRFPCGDYPTQDLNVQQQLSAGIRVFDIRARYSLNDTRSYAFGLQTGGSTNPDYYIFRDEAITDLRLRDVLNDIYQWMIDPAHEKEVVRLEFQGMNLDDCDETKLNGLPLRDESNKAFSSGAITTFSCQGANDAPTGFSSRTQEICNVFNNTVGQLRDLSNSPDDSLNQIWARWKPATNSKPRLIASSLCDTALGGDAGYWANQCYVLPYLAGPVRQGILAPVVAALQGRYASAGDAKDGVSAETYGTTPVRGFYSLGIVSSPTQDCAIYESSRMGEQLTMLDNLKDWYRTYAYNARTNLNMVSGNYIEQQSPGGWTLVSAVLAMNQEPSIAVHVPADQSPPTTYALNQVVVASFDCATASGDTSNVSSCTGSAPNCTVLDTASAGAKSLELRANAPDSFLVPSAAESGVPVTRTISYTVSSTAASPPAGVNPGDAWIAGADSSINCFLGDRGAGAWQTIDGAGVRIAVGPDRTPWVVNSANQIFHRSAAGVWAGIAGVATDIGVGADGSVWIIGDGGAISHLRADGSGFDTVDGAAVRISVGPDGQPWVVNAAGQIYRRNKGASSYVDGSWTLLPGSAHDIGIGADGTAWSLGATATGTTNEYPVQKWTGSAWQTTDGSGVSIAVGRDGQPWVVNGSGAIYRHSASGWAAVPGTKATDVGVGGTP